ncbi:MAG: sulfatase-like hydrolase/transferase [Planctomycetota bacterium]
MLRAIASVSILGLAIQFGPASDKTEDRMEAPPNIVFILTDDHRWDSYGASSSQRIRTPKLDQIADRGTRFENAFVTLAICSPSRAACLSGRYRSVNGVTSVGNSPLRAGERTFAHALREAGYATGVAGKWHLKTTPEECGFDFASTCWSNGTWYDRKFQIDGETQTMPGFVDDVAADESLRFIDEAVDSNKPFVLWLCTQVPHMDHRFRWPAKENILNHTRDYLASVQQMDAAVGRVLSGIEDRGLSENTWFIFMGDNGWFLGEHGFTSKVLAYEESMRVPMAIAGPKTQPRVSEDLVLNIDLTATIYAMAGLPIPDPLHGRSLLPMVERGAANHWRTSFLYEAPTPQLGSRPLWANRNE